MNPIRFFVRQLLLIAALVCNGAAFAHGIWFGQRAGEFAMIYGHGAEDLNLVERQQRVTSIAGFDAALQPVAIDLKPSGGSMPKAVRKNGTATLSVRNQGLNVIKAEFESPPADAAKADKQEHLATLSFVLGHRKE